MGPNLRFYTEYTAAWEALFIWDCLIFTLTIVKTYKTRRQEPESDITRGSIANLMLRDG